MKTVTERPYADPEKAALQIRPNTQASDSCR